MRAKSTIPQELKNHLSGRRPVGWRPATHYSYYIQHNIIFIRIINRSFQCNCHRIPTTTNYYSCYPSSCAAAAADVATTAATTTTATTTTTTTIITTTSTTTTALRLRLLLLLLPLMLSLPRFRHVGHGIRHPHKKCSRS